MDVKVADTILREADRAGFVQGGIPESNEDKLAKAERLVKQAEQALRVGSKNATVMTILKLVDQGTEQDDPPFDPDPPNGGKAMENEGGPPVPEQPTDPIPEETPKKKTRKKPVPKNEVVPDKRDIETYEGLPIPPDVDAPSESLPSDFTVLADLQVRSLHSQYHAYLGRVLWLLAQEEGQKDRAQRLYDRALGAAIGHTGVSDERVTVRKIEALADKTVIEWSERLSEHVDRVRAFKALRDYYEGTCTRLSREFSMREAERETAR